eukprot:1331397-Rhodomonas_salina.1
MGYDRQNGDATRKKWGSASKNRGSGFKNGENERKPGLRLAGVGIGLGDSAYVSTGHGLADAQDKAMSVPDTA